MEDFLFPDWAPLVFGAVCFLTVLVPFLASPLIAMMKGYAPYYWLFACGPVGLIVILFRPSLKSSRNPEDYERWQQQTNLIGGILSGIQIFLGLMLSLLVLAVFA